ncbi:zinc finger BED domain-containing protein RICESLEEPER 2-like [Arachis duranensis]|uniref:Zinc finger BED domain-containing protein RICESLEEPER 2-like n=1 Tax=Arachis duranensis TaxID=130453 RepID=A0A9C6WT87_ARADU|nr:zinc finger BED domain-containing protein RICESLEEPER 2-like [Arachis duranensis]
MTTPTIDERGVLNSPSASKFDQEEARRALVEMFIGEELPFCFVESPKFRKFVHALQARFKVPSRTTLARDIGALYAEEKMKLQDFLSANCEVALKHRKEFELLALKDNTYIGEMNGGKGRGVPSDSDWEYAESIVPFLRVFNDASIRVSGTLYVTSDMYMKEVFAIGRFIRHSCDSVDFSTMSMAERMRVKYEKYWGNPDSVNMLLLIAIVLNPMQKIEYVNYFLDYFFGEEKGGELKSKLSKCIKLLYQQYQSSEEASEADTQDVQANNINIDLHGMGFFLQATGRRTNTRSELDRYLQEECEPYSHKFDILNWWKVNSTRFPILGNMAREVLAIPVSTIASESAFSTGGRVLNPYRSSLTPRMVEALVCTGDWFKEDLFSALDDDGEVLQQVDQDIFSSNDGACSMAASIDNIDDD